MNVELRRQFTFHAAHHLPWHAGACRNVHGHTYVCEIAITGPLTDSGVVLDFADLDTAVREHAIDRLDHTDLNTLYDNPTAELIALDITERLIAAGLAVSEVVLWETPTSSVRITP